MFVCKTLKLFLGAFMCLSFAIPSEVNATALRIQSVGSKFWKVNAPLDLTKVIFHVDNIHSKHTLDLVTLTFHNKFGTFIDEFKQKTGREKLRVTMNCGTDTDLKNVSDLSFSLQCPPADQAAYTPFIQTNLLDVATPKLKEGKLIDEYKAVYEKQIQSFSETTLWSRISSVVYNAAGDPKSLIPMCQSSLKQIDAYGTIDRAPIIESIGKGSFQGTVIGDMDEALLQEWSDWADKNFSGKAEQWQSSPRNFDGKVHYVANKTLKDKHNVVMLLPMVTVDSPYYAHSLILKEFLLPTMTQGQGGALYGALKFGAQPFFYMWNRDLALGFQCPDRETSVHINAVNAQLSKVLTAGLTKEQFMQAKESTLAFLEYFKTDVNLLTEFVGLLRRVTQSAEKANEIVNQIDSTLNSLTYEQFSESLKEFYMPQQATYFFEGEVNTVGGKID